MYGKHGDNAISRTLAAGIRVDPIAEGGRMGQQFVADLEDRLNPGGAVPGNPAYRLGVSLKNSDSAIGVDPDGTITRYNVFLSSRYVLTRIADGKRMAAGSIDHVSSYNNVTNAYFSTHIAEQDAIRRGVTELAEIYRQRLAAQLTGSPPPEDAGAADAISLMPDPSMDMRHR